jgi:hypothetical protein
MLAHEQSAAAEAARTNASSRRMFNVFLLWMEIAG